VRWQGRPARREEQRQFGYMPEERGLYPEMHADRQLRYRAELHGRPPAEAAAAVDNWTDRLGLGDLPTKPVEELSLENQQRVQLAAALVHDPQLLILDEPFSGLDPIGVDVMSEVLRERAAAGVPVLGICLGMQLLFESSTEHEGAEGLGLLEGEVTRLRANGHRLPHIGWNLVTLREARITAELPAEAAFYHVHSFACRPAREEDVVGTAEYGETFATVVERGNVAGAQFHPEKSSAAGLALLRGFVRGS
jgi:imidazole glycerol phosphate synthase glutamine amidotransferase subunit